MAQFWLNSMGGKLCVQMVGWKGRNKWSDGWIQATTVPLRSQLNNKAVCRKTLSQPRVLNLDCYVDEKMSLPVHTKYVDSGHKPAWSLHNINGNGKTQEPILTKRDQYAKLIGGSTCIFPLWSTLNLQDAVLTLLFS